MNVASSSEQLHLRPGPAIKAKVPAENVSSLAPGDVRFWSAGETLAAQGPAPDLWVMLSGWAARTRTLADGRRQITRLILPGDIGPSLSPVEPNCTIVAITGLRTVAVGILGETLESGAASRVDARKLLQRHAHEEERELLNQLVRLGRLSAYERTAHLIVELFVRLTRAGQVAGTRMPLPLTQEMLGDLLGLSIVHMNRTLQQLRRDGLIIYKGGEVRIPDLAALADVGGYDPGALPAAPPEPRSVAAARRDGAASQTFAHNLVKRGNS